MYMCTVTVVYQRGLSWGVCPHLSQPLACLTKNYMGAYPGLILM